MSASLFVVLFAGVVGCSIRSGASGEVDKTFHLEAHEGVFVRDGDENPTLTVDRGDRVELTFENTDRGIHHAIAVPSFMEGVREVDWGERTSVTFTATRSGTFQYTCPHHDPVMEGKLVVRPTGE
jgi:plastocyanin